MASTQMNNKRFCLGGLPCDIFAEATFAGSSGTIGAPTLVTTSDKSRGVKALLQAKAASKIYLLTLNDKWVDLKAMSASFGTSAVNTTLLPAISNVLRLSKTTAVGGGIAVICPASVQALDTITLKKPGSASVVLTAVAYNATPGDNQWCIGNTTGADAESANNIAAIIRNDSTDAGQGGKGDTNGNGGSTTMPSGITAYAAGDVVVISTTEPGWMVCTSNITRLPFKATGTGVAATFQTMDPGVVFATAVGVTPTSAVEGDRMQMNLVLENGSRTI